jgi:hypothetical protein
VYAEAAPAVWGDAMTDRGLPTEALVVQVLELAELFGWPRAAIPP